MMTCTGAQAALLLTKRSSSSSAKVMSSLLRCYGVSTTATSSVSFSSLSYPRPQTITIKSEFDTISLTWRKRRQQHLGSSNHGGGGFGSKLLMRKAAGFSTSSSNFNASSSGSIDSPMVEAMTNKIKEQLKADSVIVKDAYGDGRHVSIDVVSAAFEGQSAVNRQRMVYQAIREELQSTVHAVDQMTTRTPAEAGKN